MKSEQLPNLITAAPGPAHSGSTIMALRLRETATPIWPVKQYHFPVLDCLQIRVSTVATSNRWSPRNLVLAELLYPTSGQIISRKLVF